MHYQILFASIITALMIVICASYAKICSKAEQELRRAKPERNLDFDRFKRIRLSHTIAAVCGYLAALVLLQLDNKSLWDLLIYGVATLCLLYMAWRLQKHIHVSVENILDPDRDEPQ